MRCCCCCPSAQRRCQPEPHYSGTKRGGDTTHDAVGEGSPDARVLPEYKYDKHTTWRGVTGSQTGKWTDV